MSGNTDKPGYSARTPGAAVAAARGVREARARLDAEARACGVPMARIAKGVRVLAKTVYRRLGLGTGWA